MEILQRIMELVKSKAKSKREFAALIGLEQVTFNNYMIGKRGLSYEVIDAILRTFPDVSAEWLMRGIGDMIKNENANETIHKSEKYDAEVQIGEDGYLKIKIKDFISK